jgi:hypothetical protein
MRTLARAPNKSVAAWVLRKLPLKLRNRTHQNLYLALDHDTFAYALAAKPKLAASVQNRFPQQINCAGLNYTPSSSRTYRI